MANAKREITQNFTFLCILLLFAASSSGNSEVTFPDQKQIVYSTENNLNAENKEPLDTEKLNDDSISTDLREQSKQTSTIKEHFSEISSGHNLEQFTNSPNNTITSSILEANETRSITSPDTNVLESTNSDETSQTDSSSDMEEIFRLTQYKNISAGMREVFNLEKSLDTQTHLSASSTENRSDIGSFYEQSKIEMTSNVSGNFSKLDHSKAVGNEVENYREPMNSSSLQSNSKTQTEEHVPGRQTEATSTITTNLASTEQGAKDPKTENLNVSFTDVISKVVDEAGYFIAQNSTPTMENENPLEEIGIINEHEADVVGRDPVDEGYAGQSITNDQFKNSEQTSVNDLETSVASSNIHSSGLNSKLHGIGITLSQSENGDDSYLASRSDGAFSERYSTLRESEFEAAPEEAEVEKWKHGNQTIFTDGPGTSLGEANVSKTHRNGLLETDLKVDKGEIIDQEIQKEKPEDEEDKHRDDDELRKDISDQLQAYNVNNITEIIDQFDKSSDISLGELDLLTDEALPQSTSVHSSDHESTTTENVTSFDNLAHAAESIESNSALRDKLASETMKVTENWRLEQINEDINANEISVSNFSDKIEAVSEINEYNRNHLDQNQSKILNSEQNVPDFSTKSPEVKIDLMNSPNSEEDLTDNNKSAVNRISVTLSSDVPLFDVRTSTEHSKSNHTVNLENSKDNQTSFSTLNKVEDSMLLASTLSPQTLTENDLLDNDVLGINASFEWDISNVDTLNNNEERSSVYKSEPSSIETKYRMDASHILESNAQSSFLSNQSIHANIRIQTPVDINSHFEIKDLDESSLISSIRSKVDEVPSSTEKPSASLTETVPVMDYQQKARGHRDVIGMFNETLEDMVAKNPEHPSEMTSIALPCGLDIVTCPVLNRLKGLKGDAGPTGLPGPIGAEGVCPATVCSKIKVDNIKGVDGPPGICKANCPAIEGPRGPQGNKGIQGDAVGVSEEEMVTYVNENAMEIDESITELIHRRRRRRRRRIRRKRRKVRSLSNFIEVDEKRSSSISSKNVNCCSSQEPILGLLILDSLEELKTRGSQLPVGSIVAANLYVDKQQPSMSPPPMGMFMKTDEQNNLWNRIPVAFEKEVTFDTAQKVSRPHSSYSPTDLPLPSSQLQLVLAFYPQPVDGAEFSGWYGADALCRQFGEERLGIPGFRVFLSDNNLPVGRILPWRFNRIPVVNLAGVELFRSLKDFLYGMPPSSGEPLYGLDGLPYIDENEYSQEKQSFWFGFGKDYSCQYWSSNRSNDWSLVWSMSRTQARTDYARCNQTNFLLCYTIIRKASIYYER